MIVDFGSCVARQLTIGPGVSPTHHLPTTKKSAPMAHLAKSTQHSCMCKLGAPNNYNSTLYNNNRLPLSHCPWCNLENFTLRLLSGAIRDVALPDQSSKEQSVRTKTNLDHFNSRPSRYSGHFALTTGTAEWEGKKKRGQQQSLPVLFVADRYQFLRLWLVS